MNRILMCIFYIILINSFLNSQTYSRGYSGIINDNTIRIRDMPSLEGKIIGQLNQGMTITILGRSQNRMYLDGYDSYWIKIKKDNIEGWSYGAYINLISYQYYLLPVVSTTVFSSIIDLSFSRQLPIEELIQKEKETLKKQAGHFLNCGVEDYYNAIVDTFKQQQSLRPFFLNTHEVGITETSRFLCLSSSTICDYIQASYSDNITISPLIMGNEVSASFIINGFKKKSEFSGIQIASMAINIKKIKDTNFIPLAGKTIIDFISISPYSEGDFIEHSWGDIEYFYSFMTSGSFHTDKLSSFLQKILD